MPFDYHDLSSPAYVCHMDKLRANLEQIEHIKTQTGAHVLLALKGFAMHATFDTVANYLDGCTASGLHEAQLANEYFGKEIHTYSPAFEDEDIKAVARISEHIVFNSPAQLKRHIDTVKQINPHCHISLRVNPQTSAAPVDLYNPCAPFSRLGTTRANFDSSIVTHLDGLNFHALCEQNVDALQSVLEAFEAQFGEYIDTLKYVNFGGGHHITRSDYDVQGLIDTINAFKARHPNVQVYLEPGEAIGWHTGVLVAQVVDIIDNGMKLAILNISAEAHMPDTLAMPYRAEVLNSAKPYEKPYTYRLGGNTCLAGDVMGDYSFDTPLEVGDTVVFDDQIHYTFVKSTTFNGVKLPDLVIEDKGRIVHHKRFGYEEYKNRLS